MYVLFMPSERGSSRLAGMILPGNGAPVAGSMTGLVEAEKLPARSSAVGGKELSMDWERRRSPSYEKKKNDRPFPLKCGRITGPPTLPPNWFCFRIGVVAANALRALTASLRR